MVGRDHPGPEILSRPLVGFGLEMGDFGDTIIFPEECVDAIEKA